MMIQTAFRSKCRTVSLSQNTISNLNSETRVFQGTCEMVFYTSGEAAAEKDPIIINLTDIRNMAGWVID